jgi:hypothetical protein
LKRDWQWRRKSRPQSESNWYSLAIFFKINQNQQKNPTIYGPFRRKQYAKPVEQTPESSRQ